MWVDINQSTESLNRANRWGAWICSLPVCLSGDVDLLLPPGLLLCGPLGLDWALYHQPSSSQASKLHHWPSWVSGRQMEDLGPPITVRANTWQSISSWTYRSCFCVCLSLFCFILFFENHSKHIRPQIVVTLWPALVLCHLELLILLLRLTFYVFLTLAGITHSNEESLHRILPDRFLKN